MPLVPSKCIRGAHAEGRHARLQPPPRTVAASTTHGCSLLHARLQPPPRTVLYVPQKLGGEAWYCKLLRHIQKTTHRPLSAVHLSMRKVPTTRTMCSAWGSVRRAASIITSGSRLISREGLSGRSKSR